MPTLEDIRSSVKNTLQDSSYSDDAIDVIINKGLDYVSQRILLSELESSGVVTTILAECEVVIPDSWNMQRNLYSCEIEDKNSITVLSSVALLEREYPVFEKELETGDITHLSTRSGSIVYYPVPNTAQEMYCKFYINPTHLVSDSDIPSCIPVGSQTNLLENYALWKLFKTIEDGSEGKLVNTKYYMDLFYFHLEELDDLVNVGQSRAKPHRPNNWI